MTDEQSRVTDPQDAIDAIATDRDDRVYDHSAGDEQDGIPFVGAGPGDPRLLTVAGRDLLAEADFSPQPHERVLLIRGEGGRQRLQQALRARHVEVAEWAVYRRQRPVGVLDIPPDWLHSRLAFTIVTSASGLENLLGMADPTVREWLLQSRLITVSERIAQLARQLGFHQPVIAAGADDQALTDAVVANRQEQK